MKTLVFMGAARKNGHTRKMVDVFMEHAKGEVEIIDAYRTADISPCIDCRYCWKVKGCAVKDGMQEIYQKIEEADRIVIASPMYFHCIPGPLKTMFDRLQVYWAGHGPRQDAPGTNIRKGMLMMVGGAPSFEGQFQAGEIVLKGILGDLSTECIGCVTLSNSDQDSLESRPEVKEQIVKLTQELYKEE